MLSIMVIDDEPEIVTAMIACAEARGIAVHGFTRAPDAVTAFAAEPGRYDCIVTDIYMPEMDGIELIRALRQICMGIPIIAATGHPLTRSGSGYALRAAETFGANVAIQKPYGCKALCDLAASLASLNTCGARAL